MNLRKVTIRATSGMLLATVITPIFCLVVEGWYLNFSDIFVLIFGTLYTLYALFLLWLFSGSPMLITFILAVKLKHVVPNAILLAATLGYAILFVYSQFMYIMSDSDMRSLWLLTPLGSLWWMVPAWFAALSLNSRYVKIIGKEPKVQRSRTSG